jgi:putative membrane protein
MSKPKKMRERSVVKGALAGLVGGIAGSGAKALAQKIYPREVVEGMPPPVAPPDQAAEDPQSERAAALTTAEGRLVFGAVAGAAYGAAVEIEPKAAAWWGAGFGLALNKLSRQASADFDTPPKTGFGEQSVRQLTRQRQSEWVTQAVYGVVTEAVRRLVRKGL